MILKREAAWSPSRAKQPAGTPRRGDRRAPGAESIAGVLALQRMAGNTAVQALLRRASGAAIQRQVGWTGVDPGSWNFGPRDVREKPGDPGVKRIPVEGLPQGHASGAVDKDHPDVPKQDDADNKVDDPETGKWSKVSTQTPEAAGGAKTGRAIVLIPNGLPATTGTVEVLFHLHGFTPGGRGRGATGTGAPEDVSVTRIAQQLEASKRPMIAILPQGTKGGGGFWAEPGKFDLNKYIDEALDLVPAKLWPNKTKRTPGGVFLSGHSGGGDVIAHMISGKQVPGSAAGSRAVQGLLLFDALHASGPGTVAGFLTRKLNEELAQLHDIWNTKSASAPPVAPDVIADAQTAWLQKSGFRFRGFASAKSYFKVYEDELKPTIARWFKSHASLLGGVDSCVFRTLSANYLDQSVVPAGTEHEGIVGGTVDAGKREHQHLLESLSELPAPNQPQIKDCTRAPAQPAPKKAPKPRPAKAAKPAVGRMRERRTTPVTASATARRLSRAPATEGWAGVDTGPNLKTRTTTGTSIRRVPVKGIAAGRGKGNALVLIPEWLPAVKTVEVLLHLHGHKWPGYGVGYETAEDENVYRVEQALDQFSTDKKRPIIAVLPQGGAVSQFGKGADDLDAGVYIQQAIAAVPLDKWPNGPAPQAGGVILSGHSGAGGRFADMFGTTKMPGGNAAAPGRLESFFSFDTINGKTGQKVSEIEQGNEYKQHVAFVRARLDADLQMLKDERAKAAGQTEPQIQTALEAKLVRDGFRFRAFYTGSPNLKKGGKAGEPKELEPTAESGYADRYFLLKREVDAWFDAHAQDLGGTASKAYVALRANYTIEPAGTEHMQMMGGVQERKGGPWQHENLRTALGSLPTVPQGGP